LLSERLVTVMVMTKGMVMAKTEEKEEDRRIGG
jgi:hypothetical protein